MFRKEYSTWGVTVTAALFLYNETSKKLKMKKFSSVWKLHKFDKGGKFWVVENDSGHKNSFLKRLNPFIGVGGGGGGSIRI